MRIGKFTPVAIAFCVTLSACSPFPVSRLNTRLPKETLAQKKTNQAGMSYVVFGRKYHVLRSAIGYEKRGIASWYGPNFRGKLTSSGTPYNMYAMTAASKVLPLFTWVKVTNLENGRVAIVQINDRGPFVANRIIDLSYAAARHIGMVRGGTALVELQALTGPSLARPSDLVAREHAVKPVHLDRNPRLYVQLGAFAVKQNAERLKARLLLNQVGKIHVAPMRAKGERLYRVLVGPVAGVKAIDSLTARLERLGFSKTNILIN